MSPSHSTQYRNVSVRGQDDNAPIRIEADDIIMLIRGNVHPLRESHDLVMNPISSQVSEFQQAPQAQVRTNGLSRRTSFRSQPLPGQQKSLSVPVSIPKSPLLMNGDVTTNVTSAQQLT